MKRIFPRGTWGRPCWEIRAEPESRRYGSSQSLLGTAPHQRLKCPPDHIVPQCPCCYDLSKASCCHPRHHRAVWSPGRRTRSPLWKLYPHPNGARNHWRLAAAETFMGRRQRRPVVRQQDWELEFSPFTRCVKSWKRGVIGASIRQMLLRKSHLDVAKATQEGKEMVVQRRMPVPTAAPLSPPTRTINTLRCNVIGADHWWKFLSSIVICTICPLSDGL